MLSGFSKLTAHRWGLPVVEIDIEWHRARACTGKRYFSEKAEAKAEAKAVSKRRGIKLRIYSCAFCDGYHMTSHSLSDMEAIQQTFGEAWAAAQQGVK
jgi:hypothetical protein